jgi:glycosyltransferase involved in cell wall biosynthesis
MTDRNWSGLSGRHVIIVLYALELGGAEHQALLLARHLAQKGGARVQVWGFVHPGRVAELCEEQGLHWQLIPIEIGSMASTDILKAAFGLGLLLRRARADIILPYLTPPNILCGLAWRFTGARLCVWNQRNGGVERISPKLELLAARMTPWFISNSSQGAEFLVRELNVQSKKITVIPNGVELGTPEADVSTWHRRLGLRGDSFVACMVANLHGGKDHVTLLKAWQNVVQRLANLNRYAVLVLAGRFDSTEESLRDLSRELGIADHVRFLGLVKDIAGLLRAVNVGVLTSGHTNYEGCSNATLEYMASGLPVAGTDIPGIRTLVDPSGYPFLVPIGDVKALTDRIFQLAVDPDLRVKLGKAQQQRALTDFTVMTTCGRTVEFIQEAMSVRRPTPAK